MGPLSFPLYAGSTYNASGTSGSADYTLYLNNAGGAFGGPAGWQAKCNTWVGSATMMVSMDGTAFRYPYMTELSAGTAGTAAWPLIGLVGAGISNGTAFILNNRAPLKAMRLTCLTVSGTIWVDWGALAV